VLVLLAAVLMTASITLLVRSCERTPRKTPDAVSDRGSTNWKPPVLSASPNGDPRPTPDDPAREIKTHTSTVLVRASGGEVFEVDLYGREHSGSLTPIGKATTGLPVEVRFPQSARRVVASPSRSSHFFFAYDDGEVSRADHGALLEIDLPRSSDRVLLRAQWESGEPVQGVGVSLSAIARPEDDATRVTDARGEATWDGVRRNILGSSPITVVHVPEGARVLSLSALREVPDRRRLYEATLRFSSCSSNARIRADGCVFPTAVLERRDGDGWTRALDSGSIVSIEDEGGTDVRSRRQFPERWVPRPVHVVAHALCEGEYRCTVYDSSAGVLRGTFRVDGRSTVSAELGAARGIWHDGEVGGVARGKLSGLSLVFTRTKEGFEYLLGTAVEVVVRSDGSFRVAVPDEVTTFELRHAPKESDGYFVVPTAAANRAPTFVRVESTIAVRVIFRIRDDRGRPVPGARLEAVMRHPIGSDGAEARTWVGEGVTDAAGRVSVGPGGRGKWEVVVRADGWPERKASYEVGRESDDEIVFDLGGPGESR
jgi:hypothetical protein